MLLPVSLKQGFAETPESKDLTLFFASCFAPEQESIVLAVAQQCPCYFARKVLPTSSAFRIASNRCKPAFHPLIAIKTPSEMNNVDVNLYSNQK